eukprot:4501020-Pleurochrysis_carterae.AAC.1
MHDSFRGYPAAWWDFMKGCPNKAMDSHIYQAWNMPSKIDKYLENACNFKGGLQTMHDLLDMPMIVGEWSLATDNCAMWLNGFNDNLPGYPKVTCDMQPCAKPYMGAEQPGAPPDPEEPLQGPYGTGVSGPQFGFCPVGFKWGTQARRLSHIAIQPHGGSVICSFLFAVALRAGRAVCLICWRGRGIVALKTGWLSASTPSLEKR